MSKHAPQLIYIDTHMHLTERYKHVENTPVLVERAQKNNVEKLILLATNLSELDAVLAIARQYHGVYPGLGVHPLDIKTGQEAAVVRQKINSDVVAIGEVGLDYHYANAPTQAVQKKVLREQLIIAKDYDLAVSLHARDAYDDVYELINVDQFRNLRIILHTFSGTLEQAKRFLQLPNIYFGISGVITFKNARQNRAVLAILPLTKIVTETDTPYLTPDPHRGQSNEPRMVIHIARKIAELKNLPEAIVCQQVLENSKKIFQL